MTVQTHDSTPNEGEKLGGICMFATLSAKLPVHSILTIQLSVMWHDVARRAVIQPIMQMGSCVLVSSDVVVAMPWCLQ